MEEWVAPIVWVVGLLVKERLDYRSCAFCVFSYALFYVYNSVVCVLLGSYCRRKLSFFVKKSLQQTRAYTCKINSKHHL